MTNRASGKRKLPRNYPSVPDRESGPTRYDEPVPPIRPDRAPPDRFRPGNTRADLRLAVERLLQRREMASPEAWAALGPDARRLLVELLDDQAISSHDALWHRLISVVGELGIESAVGRLGAILADDGKRAASRAFAANALGRIGAAAAIEPLAAAATAKDAMLRRQVAMALGRIQHHAAVPHLLQLRDDSSVAVAEVAAEALSRWENQLGQRLGTKLNRPAASARAPKRQRLPGEER